MEKVLRYYMFDWDDNILHMPTSIHMINNGKPVDIFPDQYAKVRKDPEWLPAENAYDEFRDIGPRGYDAFLYDVMMSIGLKRFGPSWDTFINTLINAEIFLIITTRGHSTDNFKRAIKHIIENCLTPEQRIIMTHNIMYLVGLFRDNAPPLDKIVDCYLDYCMFVGICSPEFEDRFGFSPRDKSVEYAKEVGVHAFIDMVNRRNQILGYHLTVGFSDDDKGYLKQIKKSFAKKSEWGNVVGLYIYDTSNPNKIKKTISYQKDPNEE